jgi:hypothetical protein
MKNSSPSSRRQEAQAVDALGGVEHRPGVAQLVEAERLVGRRSGRGGRAGVVLHGPAVVGAGLGDAADLLGDVGRGLGIEPVHLDRQVDRRRAGLAVLVAVVRVRGHDLTLPKFAGVGKPGPRRIGEKDVTSRRRRGAAQG